MSRVPALICVFLLAVAAPVGAVTALPDGFESQVVATGLQLPVALAHLPDGRLLVVEQKTGEIQLVLADDTLVPTPVYTVTGLETLNGEAGLLSLAVDPGWPERPYIYCHYTNAQPREMRLARYTAMGTLGDGTSSDLAFGSELLLITGIPDLAGNHNGGTLEFGPDGYLYFSVGDDEEQCAAQQNDSLLGKVLRLDVGSVGATGPVALADLVAAGNPYAGQGDLAQLVWTKGLRNPFRMTIDRETGALFIGDVGQNQREEISRVTTAGVNLGWPFREGTLTYVPNDPCEERPGAVYQDPIWDYAHTLGRSVIAGFVYRAPNGANRAWPAQYDGDFFFVDFYTGNLRRLTGSGQSWSLAPAVAGQPTVSDWATGLVNPADLTIGPDGSIVYVSLTGGSIHRIRTTTTVDTEESSFGRMRARFRQ